VPFEGVRPAASLPRETSELLYVARLEKRKNHLVLLDACERLWNEGVRFRLRLIGCKSYPVWTRRVLDRIRVLQDRGRDLIWMPHVSDAVLHEAYQSCRFTLFPSRAEGFGLPIIESLWHGRPVLCGSGGAVLELAEGGGCWIVDTNEPGNLAHGIRVLLEDQATYQRLLQECGSRKMLSWNEYWDSMKRFFGR
jgi:glycosyltransferase involved in cell wall biosynthesis